jgi:hypothetical protein
MSCLWSKSDDPCDIGKQGGEYAACFIGGHDEGSLTHPNDPRQSVCVITTESMSH